MGNDVESIPLLSDAFALADSDADTARRWLSRKFAEQRADGAPDALSAAHQAGLVRVLTMDWWQVVVWDEDRSSKSAADELDVLLPAAVRAASAIPNAGVVLALYLRNLVNEAWALSWDHRLIRSAIDAALGAVDGTVQDGASTVAWALLDFMHSEFDVESALLTGRLQAVVAIASRAAASIAHISRAAQGLPTHPGQDALVSEAASEERYYRAVHDIALASHALLSRRTLDASAEVSRIGAEIADGGFRAVDASELRGHLASLICINDAAQREWLHMDEGRVRIIYGFGIAQPDARDGAQSLTELRELIDRRRLEGGSLGALRIDKVLRRLTLSDVWQGADSLGRAYRGTTVHLEDLVLDIADGNMLVGTETVRTRIQLSELGNHIVVFELDIHDAGAYEVAETINLATPVFGDLTEIRDALHLHPASDPGMHIARLTDVVTGILDGLRELLQEVSPTHSFDPVSSRAGSFGVLVTVTQASSDSAGRRTPLSSAHDVRGLWGTQPLLHPLPAGASGVADWTRYDIDVATHFNLLHLNDELLSANTNITLLASLSSPDYAVSEIESYIEFAHSMHGMYQAWQSTVRTHAERIADLLERVEDELVAADAAAAAEDDRAQERVITELGELVRVIERAELTLQSFVQSKQATMLFVESPAIVSSPALRADLDTILRSNGYRILREGFERAVRDVLGTRLQPLLEVCHRRIALVYENRQAARERRTERLAEVLGAILAVMGLSGLVSVLQDGFELRGDITWWFLSMILLAAAVLGAALVIEPRRRRRRKRAASAQRRASRP